MNVAESSLHDEVRALARQLMPSWPAHARFYAEALLDAPTIVASRHLAAMAWDALHTTPWHEAELCWRHVYATAQLSAAFLVQRDAPRDAVALLDLALLLGAPPLTESVHRLIDLLGQRIAADADDGDDEGAAKRARTEPVPDESDLIAPGAMAIERVHCPSLEAFRDRFFLPSVPVIITGAMAAWPALNERPWADLTYLKRVAGFRSVPIELGQNYLADDWSQQMMPLERFIDEYVMPNRVGGYLAQTQLFEQIRPLARDIATPDYCALSGVHNTAEFDARHTPEHAREARRSSGAVDVHAWFGPGGTVSPCHHDPANNLLCQVVGAKRVRLYDHRHTELLYPHDQSDRMRWNSSRADVRRPDAAAFPRVVEAPFFECVLQAGEMLFIPPRWWHAVDAITRSFSVSFWWS